MLVTAATVTVNNAVRRTRAQHAPRDARTRFLLVTRPKTIEIILTRAANDPESCARLKIRPRGGGRFFGGFRSKKFDAR